MIKHFFTKQFIKFVAVGGTAAFLHWITRILLSIWLPFGWAVALAYMVGIAVAFLLNKRFVFPASNKPLNEQVKEFIAINLCFYPVVWFASIWLNDGLKWLGIVHFSEEFAHAIAISLPMFATFLIYKLFTFKVVHNG